MADLIEVSLSLTRDKPNSMNFEDTYSGLDDIWYKFETDASGSITLSANSDGFEHLARYFLKMARSGKRNGYHAHHALEFGEEAGAAELTIAFADQKQ
jgi:hypothetical protein